MSRPTGVFKRPPMTENIPHGFARYCDLSKADLWDAFLDLWRETNGMETGERDEEAMRDAERRSALQALAAGRPLRRNQREAIDREGK